MGTYELKIKFVEFFKSGIINLINCEIENIIMDLKKEINI